MNRILSIGLRQLFGGARSGRPAIAALGAALSLLGWMRHRRRKERGPVYERVLEDGEMLKVRLVRGKTVVEATRSGD